LSPAGCCAESVRGGVSGAVAGRLEGVVSFAGSGVGAGRRGRFPAVGFGRADVVSRCAGAVAVAAVPGLTLVLSPGAGADATVLALESSVGAAAAAGARALAVSTCAVSELSLPSLARHATAPSSVMATYILWPRPIIARRVAGAAGRA